MSLREFADKTSFSHTFISNLEKNYNPSTKKPPVLTFKMLDELSKILGYSLNELLDSLKGEKLIKVNVQEEIKEPFNKRLKEALKLRNVTQAKLSRRTQINEANISNYIKGTYEAKTDKIYIISKALNINPHWLIGYESPMEIEDTSEVDITNIKKIYYPSDYYDLNKEKQKEITKRAEEYIEFLVEKEKNKNK